MKARLHNCRSERGVVLVITLIMLAIVTVMAIIFLSLTRRERQSVKVSEDLANARMLAEVALERAKAQAIAQIAAGGTKLSYDMFNSTNYVQPFFTPQGSKAPNRTNVSYVDQNGNLLTGDDLLQNIANLQYDPRPPVFVPTNESGGRDFRFYLDFNRNGAFETNGLLPTLGTNGLPISSNLSRYVGDAEWVGQLQDPSRPHGEDNYFIGRYAFFALPAGKALDLNYLHNQADTNSDNELRDPRNQNRNGHNRNQGYGSWEINLAAFLRQLNSNNYAWHTNTYADRSKTVNFPRGEAFDDARTLLSFRYNGKRSNLDRADVWVTNIFPGAPHPFIQDGIDNYADDAINLTTPVPYNDILIPPRDNDIPARPWPGSLNSNVFTDVQQLFTLSAYSAGYMAFSNRLFTPMNGKKASYDRYTYYRLLSQLGVDSAPALKGKLHLNYVNTAGEVTNNVVPWTFTNMPPGTNFALQFFTNAVDLMLKASIERRTYLVRAPGYRQIVVTNHFIGDTLVRPDISVNNIQLWHVPPTNRPFATSNEYTATIHRILQVAANIYDNMTNRGGVYPYFPTVFRPVYTKTATNVFISDFVEVTNALFLRTNWVTLEEFATNSAYATREYTNVALNVYGQPLVVGSKKGHPNFNELSVETVAQVSRKIELAKPSVDQPASVTNQMYLVSLRNVWGTEAWNSYARDYDRELQITAVIDASIGLSNVFGVFTNGITNTPTFRMGTNFNIRPWAGTTNLNLPNNLLLPLYTNVLFLNDSQFRPTVPFLVNSSFASFQPLHDPPQLHLYTTNRLIYWAVDFATGRIIDFVSLDKLVTRMDIAQLMQPAPSNVNTNWSSTNINEAVFWITNRLGGPGSITVGISNQLAVSRGDIPVSDAFWRDYNYTTQDKAYGIDVFRRFIGTNQMFYRDPLPKDESLRRQAPFTPTRKLYQRYSWQVNDPLVHYMAADLWTPFGLRVDIIRPPNTPVDIRVSNLGKINERYNPWGGGSVQGAQGNTNAFRTTIKDPGVQGSDNWVFPINLPAYDQNGQLVDDRKEFRFPNVGWLGRVHRGTPWQTIYLKSSAEHTNGWALWAGSYGTHPTNDWRLLDVFTVAPNVPAASGLLSVNQTNTAAWAAVLGGVPVITFADKIISPNTPIAYNQELIEPGPVIDYIVNDPSLGINAYRSNLFRPEIQEVGTNQFTTKLIRGFESIGAVLGVPALTDYSPWVLTNMTTNHFVFGLRDEMVERIPQQILSLLQKDEPRFAVYAFGQSLRPAPGSRATTADFYNLVTNYEVTGEVITKTVFRVEGDLHDPNKPLRAVVESYKVLPPPE